MARYTFESIDDVLEFSRKVQSGRMPTFLSLKREEIRLNATKILLLGQYFPIDPEFLIMSRDILARLCKIYEDEAEKVLVEVFQGLYPGRPPEKP